MGPRLEYQVRNLERRQQKLVTQNRNMDAYRWLVRASCPPDTRIWLWSGRTREPSAGGTGTAAWWVGAQALELSGSGSVVSAASHYTFTNAYWYCPVTVVPDELWEDDISLILFGPGVGGGITGGGLTEYETATEAETALDAFLTDGIASQGPPCCQLILRNNGNTALQDQYMAIDAVNRGRSYLYRDVRGKWIL